MRLETGLGDTAGQVETAAGVGGCDAFRIVDLALSEDGCREGGGGHDNGRAKACE